MKKFSLIAFVGLIWVSSISVNAQNTESAEGPSTLTVENCVSKVLSNNFDVALANLDNQMADNATTKGNAGLLPNVSATGGANYSKNNTELKFAGGIPPTNVDGAQSTSYNGSVGLNYTLFNGFANLHTFDKLRYAQNLSETQLRITIENAVITTIGLYLDLAKVQADIKALDETIGISQTRLRRAQLAHSYGSGSTLQVYSAKVDLNTDSINLLTALNAKGNLQRQLNYLMGNQITSEVKIDTDVKAFENLNFSDVMTKAKLNNVLLVLAGIQKNIAEVDQKLSMANQYPTIALNTNYGLNASQNGAGIVLEQSNIGFSGGLSISIPIFSGGRTKIAMQNAVLQMEKSEVQMKQNEQLVEKEVYDYWTNYKFLETVLNTEINNLKTAELNVTRASEQLKLGQISSIEFRQAQLSLLASKNRINAAKFNLKKAEYQLLRLTGDLVK
ncbi:MAG: outer membrane protein [Bacteroidia bacterium]|jgi:outer membrane protein